jgi:hypothetical protein
LGESYTDFRKIFKEIMHCVDVESLQPIKDKLSSLFPSTNEYMTKLYKVERQWIDAFLVGFPNFGYTVTSPCEAIHSFLKTNIGSLGGLANFLEGVERALLRKKRKDELSDFKNSLSYSIFHKLPAPLKSLKGQISDYCLGLLLEECGSERPVSHCDMKCTKFSKQYILPCCHQLWEGTFNISSRWKIETNLSGGSEHLMAIDVGIAKDLYKITDIYSNSDDAGKQFVASQLHNLRLFLESTEQQELYMPKKDEIKIKGRKKIPKIPKRNLSRFEHVEREVDEAKVNYWIEDLGLEDSSFKILNNPKGWLTEEIISVSLRLIHSESKQEDFILPLNSVFKQFKTEELEPKKSLIQPINTTLGINLCERSNTNNYRSIETSFRKICSFIFPR